ncbi:hypothetical protein ACH495_25170 [Micromonospora sp. NPDC018662]|uniref:hypothetical protein n=1 Tax=Micromonospora sp. NPDC018662 TaxID=3364238 RepID=UPI0037A0E413
MIDVRRAGRADRAWLNRRVFPLALLGCWLLWAALAWWSAPRSVDAAELERDLTAGRVLTIVRADGWDDSGPWGRRPEPRYREGGSTIVWARPDGQFRYAYVPAPTPDGGFVEDDPATGPGSDAADPTPASADPTPASADPTPASADPTPASADPTGVDDAARWPGREADPLADPRARDATTHGGDTRADAIANTAALFALVVGVGWLLTLVAGPPPVLGTRWYWFWIGLLPFGLGVLAWAYRERWRADVPAARPRRTGWAGVGWFIVGGIAVSVAVGVLRMLLGGYVVPGG